MAWTVPWNLIGTEVSGDVGNFTIYRNKNGKKVVFPKDWRQEATSPARLNARARFALAQQNWKSLTDEQKAALEEAARRLSLCMTGQNVYISVQMKNDPEAYQTLQNQSGITLPDYTPIPSQL